MPKSEIFRLNYYVGAILAQGGNVWIENSKIVFSPTSAIERAMGAKDVEIPFPDINEIVFKGDLMRSFNVVTKNKTHKFEGSQAKKVWEILDQLVKPKSKPAAVVVIPNPAPAVVPTSAPQRPAAPVSSRHACEGCRKELEPCYAFCPYCALPVKTKCSSCRRAVNPQWIACAFCGWKFANATKA